MAFRILVAGQLADFLGVLAHRHRLRIIEELGVGERDVGSLQQALEISHSGVSQHLSLLRAHRVVAERRDGRHVFYRLEDPSIAQWLVEGLAFIEPSTAKLTEVRTAVRKARKLWGGES